MIGLPARGLGGPLGLLMKHCADSGLPPPTVLVVSKATGKPSEGLTTVQEAPRDRESVFEYAWYRLEPRGPVIF